MSVVETATEVTISPIDAINRYLEVTEMIKALEAEKRDLKPVVQEAVDSLGGLVATKRGEVFTREGKEKVTYPEETLKAIEAIRAQAVEDGLVEVSFGSRELVCKLAKK